MAELDMPDFSSPIIIITIIIMDRRNGVEDENQKYKICFFDFFFVKLFNFFVFL